MLSLSHAVIAFQRARRGGNFAEQLHLRVFLKIDEFDEARQRGTRISQG